VSSDTFNKIEGVVRAETLKAILLEIEMPEWEGPREIWLPKSQCNNLQDSYDRGETVTIEASDWICAEKGI